MLAMHDVVYMTSICVCVYIYMIVWMSYVLCPRRRRGSNAARWRRGSFSLEVALIVCDHRFERTIVYQRVVYEETWTMPNKEQLGGQET